MSEAYINQLVRLLKPSFVFVDDKQYSSVLKEAKEAVESEPQREEMLSRPGTGFGELSEDDYIPTVSVSSNTRHSKFSLINDYTGIILQLYVFLIY